jgi:hypothetical protein
VSGRKIAELTGRAALIVVAGWRGDGALPAGHPI